ncbi:MAG: 2-oxoacid:acceptor oxidoreductase family protein [Candidatus Pacearchaeota archaeon]
MRINILIAGEAGQGIDKLSDLICKIIASRGLYVFNYKDYQSLITGGINFNVINISNQKNFCYDKKYDFAIFLDKKLINLFLKDIKYKAIIIGEKGIKDEIKSKRYKFIEVDVDNLIKKYNLKKIVKNTIFLGIIAKIFGFDKDCFKIVQDNFETLIKDNTLAFEIGYNYENKIKFKLPKYKRNIFYFKGNEAIAKAFEETIDIYFAYPMTPSTSLLHNLAKDKIFTFQLESEIAVINAALGASFAGKRVAVGTSGGGFALMNEALSLAGMAELPIVIYVAMRYGPSTGAPTYSSQGDLKYIINAGHGEFAKVVLSLDGNNIFQQVINAVYLAYTYRIPVILIGDKIIAESGYSFNEAEIKKFINNAKKIRERLEKQNKKLKKNNKLIKNYPFNNPFFILPKLGEHIFKVTSYEHDEYGFNKDDIETIKKMGKRRKERIERINKIIKNGYSIYGNKNSKNLLIAYGSVANSLIEFSKNKNFKVIAINCLKPFPDISKEIKKAKKVFVFEDSLTCQLADLIKENCCIEIKNKITNHTGRIWLVEDIENMLKWKAT